MHIMALSRTARIGATMSTNSNYQYTNWLSQGESWSEKWGPVGSSEGESRATGGILECLKAFQDCPRPPLI